MKKFKYKAKLKGKKQKGEVDAETIVLAKQQLRADGYRDVVLTEIKPKKKTGLNAEITLGDLGIQTLSLIHISEPTRPY